MVNDSIWDTVVWSPFIYNHKKLFQLTESYFPLLGLFSLKVSLTITGNSLFYIFRFIFKIRLRYKL